MRRAAVVTAMAGSALAGLVLGGVGIADARDGQRSSDDSVNVSASSANTRISRDQAEAIAILAVGGGQVEKIELEAEDGGFEWHVDVIKNGTEFDVRIDADTGAVVRLRTDDGNREFVRDDDGQADDNPGDDHGDDGRIDDRGDDGAGHDPGDDHGGGDNSGPGSGSDDDSSGPGGGSDGHGGPGRG